MWFAAKPESEFENRMNVAAFSCCDFKEFDILGTFEAMH